MTVTASESSQSKIKRWWRSLSAGLRKAMNVAPQVCVGGGAALGFILSVASGSWLMILASTLLGFMLGVAVLLVPIFLYEGLKILLIRAGVFLIGVVVMAALKIARFLFFSTVSNHQENTV